MNSKYYIVAAWIVLVFGFLTVVLGWSSRVSWKRGYEEAARDFYNGNLKTELVDQQVVVWKDEQP